MRKGNAVTSRAFPLMRGSSWIKWKSRMSISLKACRLPSRSKNAAPGRTHDPQSQPTIEIYDYLRVLFSAVGQPHDPLTGRPLSRQTPQQIVDQILAYEAGSKIIVVAPLIENQAGEFRDVIEKLKREGFVRARIDAQLMELDRP